MEKTIVIGFLCILAYTILNKTNTGIRLKRTWPFQILKYCWQGFVGMNLFIAVVFGLSWWIEFMVIPIVNTDPFQLLKTYKAGIEQSLNHRG